MIPALSHPSSEPCSHDHKAPIRGVEEECTHSFYLEMINNFANDHMVMNNAGSTREDRLTDAVMQRVHTAEMWSNSNVLPRARYMVYWNTPTMLPFQGEHVVNSNLAQQVRVNAGGIFRLREGILISEESLRGRGQLSEVLYGIISSVYSIELRVTVKKR